VGPDIKEAPICQAHCVGRIRPAALWRTFQPRPFDALTPPVPVVNTTVKRWAQNLALLLASSVASIAAVELGLRAVDVSYPLLQDRDEHRGFALRPGASGWWKVEGAGFVRINSDGLRDRDHARTKPVDTIRIAILGDSYAEARSVALEDTFWAVLERELNRCESRQGRNVEVINFGVTDYGTAQELLTLRHHAWQYAPDVVLLAFFAGNDIRNNSRVLNAGKPYRPFFMLDGDNLVLDDSFKQSLPYKLMDSWYGQLILRLSDYFRTVQVMRHGAVTTYLIFKKQAIRRPAISRTADDRINVDAGVDSASIYNEPEDPVWQEAWQITERLIASMAHEVEAGGADFLVVTLPTPRQAHPDRKVREELMRRLKVADLFYPDKRVQALGMREGFRVLSLAAPFQLDAEERRVFLHGFENTALGSGHWNRNGHLLAGHLIAKHVCEHWAEHGVPARQVH
jgi:hypothetical protein